SSLFVLIYCFSGTFVLHINALHDNSCDFLAKLPMLGEVSSLNVSVATGIALYETVRQRTNTI
ncbi:TrmH family RNA methyltransferase, partial [Francisella tularensis]|uniref:TrmH family RNA methyltransferase n=1 Tax=Francisella tularensis TaxID=263 RepID=UPI002D7FA2DD